MKRKPKFLIVLLSAIITFGILMSTVGKPPLANHHPHFGQCENTIEPTMQQK